MVTILKFSTLQQAENANNQITNNIGNYPLVGENQKTSQPQPNKAKTVQWGTIVPLTDDSYTLVKPDEIYMEDVTNYTELTFAQYKALLPD